MRGWARKLIFRANIPLPPLVYQTAHSKALLLTAKFSHLISHSCSGHISNISNIFSDIYKEGWNGSFYELIIWHLLLILTNFSRVAQRKSSSPLSDGNLSSFHSAIKSMWKISTKLFPQVFQNKGTTSFPCMMITLLLYQTQQSFAIYCYFICLAVQVYRVFKHRFNTESFPHK